MPPDEQPFENGADLAGHRHLRRQLREKPPSRSPGGVAEVLAPKPLGHRGGFGRVFFCLGIVPSFMTYVSPTYWPRMAEDDDAR
jgi:hypothetical protein